MLATILMSLGLALGLGNVIPHFFSDTVSVAYADDGVPTAPDAAKQQTGKDNSSEKKDDNKNNSSGSSTDIANLAGTNDNKSDESTNSQETTDDPWASAAAQLGQDFSLDDDSNKDKFLKTKINGSDENILGNVWGIIAVGNPIFPKESETSVSYNYKSNGSKSNGSRGAVNRALAYGGALYGMGIDHSYVKSEDTNFSFGRKILGSIDRFAYVATCAANWAFSWLPGLVKYINPLTWVNALPKDGPFQDIAETIQGLYQAASQLGMVFWAFCLVILLVLVGLGFRFTNNDTHVTMGRGALGAASHYMLRVVLIITVPFMLGSILDFALNNATGMYSEDVQTTTTYPLYSTLVDFQGSVEHSRLGLPNSLNGKISVSLDPSDAPVLKHNEIVDFNAQSAGRANARDLQSTSGTMVVSDDKNQDKHGFINSAAISLLDDWTDCTNYYPSDFASFADAHDHGSKTKKDWDLGKGTSKDKETLIKGHDKDDYDSLSPYLIHGTLTGQGDFKTVAPSMSSKKINGTDDGGLSTMGMYNYLSTKFDGKGSATVIANADHQTAFQGVYHTSVGLAGRGITACGNWLLMTSELLCIALFGLLTAVFITIALFQGLARIGSYLIASGLGSIRGIAKLMVATVMVIVEFVGGALYYAIAAKIIVDVAKSSDTLFSSSGKVFSSIFPDSMSGHLASASATMNTYGIYEIVLSILLIVLTWKLWKLRGILIKGLNEIATHSVDTILTSPDRHFGGGARTSNGDYQNGLSYDANGRNDGMGTTAHSGGRLEDSVGGVRGGGTDAVTGRGSYSRKPRISNPHGMTNKYINHRQGKQEYLDSIQKANGKPMGKGEKLMRGMGYSMSRAGIKATQKLGQKIQEAGLGGIGRAVENLGDSADERQQLRTLKRQEQAEESAVRNAKIGENEKLDAKSKPQQQLATQKEETQAKIAELGNKANETAADENGEYGRTQESYDAEKALKDLRGENGEQAQADALMNLQNDDLKRYNESETPIADMNGDLAEAHNQTAMAEKNYQDLKQNGPLATQDMGEYRQSLAEAKSKVDDAKANEARVQANADTLAASSSVASGLMSSTYNKGLQNGTAKRVTNAQADQALSKVGDAYKRQANFSRKLAQTQGAQNGVPDYTKMTKQQKKEYSAIAGDLHQAKRNAAALGLSRGSYASAEDVDSSRQQIGSMMDRISSGQESDYEFGKNELSQNMARNLSTYGNDNGRDTGFVQRNASDTVEGQFEDASPNLPSGNDQTIESHADDNMTDDFFNQNNDGQSAEKEDSFNPMIDEPSEEEPRGKDFDDHQDLLS